MKTLETWFELYGESHRNPKNRLIHKICVPAIQFSLLGMLWVLPFGPLNAAQAVFAAALVFYAMLGWRPAVFMAAEGVFMLSAVAAMERMGVPLLPAHAVIFTVAWIGQFVGHKIEGRKPSFFEDLQFLLIGPLWVVKDIVPLQDEPQG